MQLTLTPEEFEQLEFSIQPRTEPAEGSADLVIDHDGEDGTVQ